MFNPVAPYRYMLPNLDLSVADIANPDLFACGSRILTFLAKIQLIQLDNICAPASTQNTKTIITF